VINFSSVKRGLGKMLPAGVIAGFIIANSIVASAVIINDINDSSDYAKESIITLTEKGIITGDQNGNFNPKGIVTRAEIVKMLVNSLEINLKDCPRRLLSKMFRKITGLFLMLKLPIEKALSRAFRKVFSE